MRRRLGRRISKGRACGRRTGESVAKKIVIHEEDAIEPNDTLLKFLRMGERGVLADVLGGEFQKALASLVSTAEAKGSAVKGKFTVTLDIATGPEGDHRITTEVNAKLPKKPRRESVLFTDKDGDVVSGPATRQQDLPLTKPASKAEEPATAPSNKM